MRKFKSPIVLRQTEKGYDILVRVASIRNEQIPSHYRKVDEAATFENGMRKRHKMLEKMFYPKPKK